MASIGFIRVIRVTFLEDEVFEGGIPMECYENARSEDFEVEDVDEAVAVLMQAGVTFAATGTSWAADPDGSRITDYATAERQETSGHLYGFAPFHVDAIIERVG
jgi:hypothetical protein